VALQVDQLRYMAEEHPDEVAYVDLSTDEELTFAAWDAAADRVARGLCAAGVDPGDRVALFVPSTLPLRWIVSYAAIHRAAAVAVPANTRLSAREVAAVLGHAEPRLALTGTELRATLDEARPSIPTLERVVVVDTPDWEELLDDDASPFQVPVTDDDLADIMYTSGTTGLPKGIAVRHRSLHMLPNGRPRWTGDRWLHGSPLFTFAGISFVFNPMKMGMGAMYLPRFDAGTWLEVVEQRRPTMAFVVPAMAQLLVGHERFEEADLSSLEVLSIGSAPLPPTLHRRLADRLTGTAVTNNYSMTEAGTAFTYLPPEELERRPGSVGIPMGTEIRIADEQGHPLPADETGEVQIKVGANRREYYRDAEASAATWDGEWLRTGDLGRLDADGYLYISGRAKDVIIRGGNNVHAADVEAVLYEHPDVAEAAVAAVPHEVLGEDIGAWVVARPGSDLTEDDVVSFCRERLADYKVPRVITFIDALPRNPTGKVLKRDLPPAAGA
jgi:acyl-CoA synthetase (AMP-forming)/AMP-acid ligase II